MTTALPPEPIYHSWCMLHVSWTGHCKTYNTAYVRMEVPSQMVALSILLFSHHPRQVHPEIITLNKNALNLLWNLSVPWDPWVNLGGLLSESHLPPDPWPNVQLLKSCFNFLEDVMICMGLTHWPCKEVHTPSLPLVLPTNDFTPWGPHSHRDGLNHLWDGLHNNPTLPLNLWSHA